MRCIVVQAAVGVLCDFSGRMVDWQVVRIVGMAI
jgi:hypothetical protein